MSKKTPLGIIFLSLICALVGCGNSNGPAEVLEVSNTLLQKEAVSQDLYIPEQLVPGRYEPSSGLYTGAYVEANSDVDGDIDAYETLFGQQMAFRVFQYRTQGDVTSKALLQCIAAKQVPYIKIMPDASYDMMPIYQLIGDLNNRYKTTVFIELFPVDQRVGDPLSYIAYYENAYKIIKKYVEDAVIVWSIDTDNVYNSCLYYPGNNLVDWIGLNAVVPKYKSGEAVEALPEEAIDYWYKTFQQEKPLMLSTVAVSHFSRLDHTYTIEDAKNKLSYFYETIPEKYPRIKGILYGDVDMYQIGPQGTEDYRLTSQDKLIEHMRMLYQKRNFLSEIVENNDLVLNQAVLYTVPSYKINDRIYITEEQLQLVCRHKALIKYIPCIMDETEIKYYELETLADDQEGWLG